MAVRNLVAIVPARGGSKGIPRKNLAPVAGVPLIIHSVRVAQASRLFSQILVSTEDPEIAEVAKGAGAQVIDRPLELATDEATSESSLEHVLAQLQENGIAPDLVFFIQATSPLTTAADLVAGLHTFDQEHADSLFSASPLHGFVWQRTSDRVTPEYDFQDRPRRQDIQTDPIIENGAFYIFRPQPFQAAGNRLHGKIVPFVMTSAQGLQIDEPSDLAPLEAILAAQDSPFPDGLESIEWLGLDFDGVLTDNRVYVTQSGKETVQCHRGDGMGIANLVRAGIHVEVISSERNPVVTARCEKLGIPAHQPVKDKRPFVAKRLLDLGISRTAAAFVGNDQNDVPAFREVNFPIAVADAVAAAKHAACMITANRGGRGAVREVADLILASREKP